MNSHGNKKRNVNAAYFTIAVLSISLVLLQGVPASANDKMEADQLVEKATMAFQSFMCDEKMGPFRELIRDAKGVMIIPSLLEGAFIVGASGGNGVLLTRDKLDGDWRGPAFYTVGGASFGFQIGGQSSEVILLAMTDRGVTSFLGNSFKLGGDAGVALGPVGMGVEASTANLSADILSFSRSKGLYGGISLDGAVVAVRDSLNKAYFTGNPSPTDILVRHSFTNPESSKLAGPVAKAANAKVTEVVKSECAGFTRTESTDSLALRN
jgi:SH3 domain-containing YSC84-like protein 1